MADDRPQIDWSRQRILGIIPARGGSRGVPRKNIRPLAGKPLIAYTLEVAAQCPCFYRVIVSTDDEEIAAVARTYGGDVPFLRPAELATHSAPTLPVIQHAIAFIEAEEGQPLDAICILQPTTPLRSADDLMGAATKFVATGTDSVISLTRLDSGHPIQVKRIDDDRITPFFVPEPEGIRRQDCQPDAYVRNGALYFVRRDVVLAGSLWGEVSRPWVMPPERGVNIDAEIDFLVAERLMTGELT